MLSDICETSMLFVRFLRDRGELVNVFMALNQRSLIKTMFIYVFVMCCDGRHGCLSVF
jgi:hypothetical protein